MNEWTFYVLAPQDRPDYRQVIAFLWGEDKDVDTDGNSYPASSQSWTELTLITRDEQEERVDVDPCNTEPLVLLVKSDSRSLAARVAYILALYTGGGVGWSFNGPFDEPTCLLAELGEGFDLDAAIRRFCTTKYARSTVANRYPE